MQRNQKKRRKKRRTPNGSNAFKGVETTSCLGCNEVLLVSDGKKVDGGWVCSEACEKLVNSRNELTRKMPYSETREAKISNSLLTYREKAKLNAESVKEFAVKNTTKLLDAKMALMSAVRLIEKERNE